MRPEANRITDDKDDAHEVVEESKYTTEKWTRVNPC